MKHSHWKLNTSNKGKLEEFQRLFAKHGQTLHASDEDLNEIDADPIRVIAHKASQLGENILVEDTTLEIEGASIGVNIRWLLDHLPRYIGRKAQWIVLLAYRQGEKVFIYKGNLSGTIVEPKGSGGFGFDPVFLPERAEETLAQSKPDAFNARAKAVEALLKGEPWVIHPCIKTWQGPWQRNHSG
ncbi:non-canonical purine NTP pyrophosphatase [Candidatus Protochlamydia phocaeensis]|uniref:non-canonical purine NTP pyrophosphatase n=1 Tax=Candidatus Protochlamydia phocaeensis TaxID=1414722 RepID=UPI000837CAE5|nr:non-canonical purine NTP pyrophosphatase [Candidatus Protochlamydia phocaeensis]